MNLLKALTNDDDDYFFHLMSHPLWFNLINDEFFWHELFDLGETSYVCYLKYLCAILNADFLNM